jgi:hypothetical protein
MWTKRPSKPRKRRATRTIVLALEELVAGLAPADPGQAGGRGDIEDDHEVGRDGEGLVNPADPRRVDALGALIGDGREVIAVEDDDLACRQSGLEVLLDVLAPVLDEERELPLGRQRVGPGRQPLDLPPPSASRQFPEKRPSGLSAERLRRAGLGRLA